MSVLCGSVEAVAIPDWLIDDPRVVHVRHRNAIAGLCADWPDWLPASVRQSVKDAGITSPWRHQVDTAQAAWSGSNVALSTTTASGKSLAYLLPIMAATAVETSQASIGQATQDLRSRLGVARHTALYLSPTKALAHDQWSAARRLGPAGWQVACLDGDSSTVERKFAREHATFVLSNPDMIHHSLLPNHSSWSSFLGSLRYVVIDEAHRYRGVFGSQVASVIRRLRRICRFYDCDPVFILTSATTSNAGVSGAELIGESEPLVEISQDCSAHAGTDVILWNPAGDCSQEASELLAKLVDDGQSVITFVGSRAQAELIAMRAADQIRSGRRVASYRAGYLPEDRRAIESDLRAGKLAGIAATNALELGIDITGLNAVIMAGFPGTLGSFWQQSGRAGRGSQDALVMLIARNDPLDEHLLDHPEMIFDRPVEHTVLYPQNPYVLRPHLAAAAAEVPLTPADIRWFGPDMKILADQLCHDGLLRSRSTGWYATDSYRASDQIDLRGADNATVEIIEESTGRVLGSVDASASDRTVHSGAVYLHQGSQWLVTSYLPEEGLALVSSADLPYYTQPLGNTDIHIRQKQNEYSCGNAAVCYGEIELSSQIRGYLRRDTLTSEVWDETPLDLPMHQMTTQSMWWSVPEEIVARLPFPHAKLGSAIHAAEHTAIGLLPAFAPCDRWDIGGLYTVSHPDTQQCTIFVHDGTPGGSGYAEHGFSVAEDWWIAALQRLANCRCDHGCPSCCVSPKCGNGNRMLDKTAAALFLTALLR